MNRASTPDRPGPPRAGGSRRGAVIFAWAAHSYTALGLVAGILALRAALGGDMRAVFLWLALSIIIDATDGPLARRARAAEVLPGFSGRRLDDLVDYVTFVLVPSLVLVYAGMLPKGGWGWALMPVISSACGFSRADAKTPDGYFTGFPSYWSIVVFYFYILGIRGWAAVAILAAFSLMVFIPFRYIDPFKTRPLRRLTVPLTLVWGAAALYTIWIMPARPPAAVRVIVRAYPFYYFLASFLLNRPPRMFSAPDSLDYPDSSATKTQSHQE